MLNTRQTRAAATVRALRPLSMDALNRATFAAKVAAAASRAEVHPKYRAQFDDAAGLPSDAVAAL